MIFTTFETAVISGRRALVLIVLMAFLATLIVGCEGQTASTDSSMAGNGKIDYRDSVEGRWVTLTVIQPYSTARGITNQLGFEWDGAQDLSESLSGNEGHVGLLFATDSSVVENRPVDISDFNFACFAKVGSIPREQAVFKTVESEEFGASPVVLPPHDEPVPRGGCRDLADRDT